MTAPKDINGEHGEIIKEIHLVALQVEMVKAKQEANHESNKEVIDRLLAKVSELPCKAHVEKFTQYDNTRKILAGTVFSIIVFVISFAYAYGVLNQTVIEHQKNSEKMWEKCCVDNN